MYTSVFPITPKLHEHPALAEALSPPSRETHTLCDCHEKGRCGIGCNHSVVAFRLPEEELVKNKSCAKKRKTLMVLPELKRPNNYWVGQGFRLLILAVLSAISYLITPSH